MVDGWVCGWKYGTIIIHLYCSVMHPFSMTRLFCSVLVQGKISHEEYLHSNRIQELELISYHMLPLWDQKKSKDSNFYDLPVSPSHPKTKENMTMWGKAQIQIGNMMFNHKFIQTSSWKGKPDFYETHVEYNQTPCQHVKATTAITYITRESDHPVYSQLMNAITWWTSILNGIQKSFFNPQLVL